MPHADNVAKPIKDVLLSLLLEQLKQYAATAGTFEACGNKRLFAATASRAAALA